VIRRLTFMVAVAALVGSAAWAQDKRVELSGNVGWTFSDGVSGSSTTINGEDFTRIDPKDSISYGGRIGFLVTHNIEVGGLFSLQDSTLQLGGVVTDDIGKEKIYNYHGYVAYNFGEEDAKVRPYVLGGLGATQFGSVDTSLFGRQHTIDSHTKFSTTWAVGVKMFPGPNFGIRLEARWTPTYIKSDAAGWWCDPYWGYCYVVGNAQYANQFDLGGGITLRF
jgi:opacity protein-like surface antigen